MFSLTFKRKYVYPFKWFYQSHIWGLRIRLSYLRLFASSVWHWDSCDYAPTLRIMEVCFREMSRLHTERGIVVDSPRVARQTLIVAELCRRLHNDDYADLAGYERYDQMTQKQKQRWAKHTEYLANQDVVYLGRMLRHIQRWWQ